ncbi:MAG: sensor domain-containing protein [Neptuniibacter sp.]
MWWSESGSVATSNGHLLQTLFDASPEPSLICRNDRFVECNQSAVEILGYSSKDELLDVHPAEISPELQPDGQASIEKANDHIGRAHKEGFHQFEWVHQHLDGSPINVIVTLVVMKFDEDIILYTTWRDISEIKYLHQSLLNSETRFHDLFKAMPIGVILFEFIPNNGDFLIRNLNSAAELILKKRKDQVKGVALHKFLSAYKSEATEMLAIMRQVWHDGEGRSYPLIHYKDHHISLWLDIEFYRTPTGELVAIIQNNTDKEESRIQLELYASVYRQSKQAILISDQTNRIISVNQAFTELTGYTEPEVKGHNPRILASGRVLRSVYEEMWNSLTENGYWQGELWDRTKEGRVYPKWITISTIRNPKGQIRYFIASFSDISEKKEAEQKIQHLAHHDPLTQLFNRFSFEERLGQAVLNAKRYQLEVAVVLIDLDHFKDINDSLGHAVGDELLKAAAKRLQSLVKESDIVARFGGDEFVLALTDIPNHHLLTMKVGMILDKLSEGYQIEGEYLFCSPSIGVSLYPDDADTVQELIKNADAAMYHAKAQGRKNYQYFSSAIADSTNKRLQIGQELHQALGNSEFELHYQPKVIASNLQLCGLEALIRWRHPTKGLISPAEFIPILEDTGLIESVGYWVINEVCRQLSHWRSLELPQFSAAINLSARQLNSPQLIPQIKVAIQKHSVPASALELEVTESVAMDNPEQAIETLCQLHELGISIAIDDFGTGYSSLAYLKKLPIQTLKLDREFVRDIETDANDAAISAATIALAHKLGLKVVAEGVETPEQQAFLSNHKCDILQGFLHGRPQSPAELERRWTSEGFLNNKKC